MPYTVSLRGRIWQATITAAGHRRRFSTRTTERKIAERIAAETEAKMWRGHLDGPGAGVTMAQAFASYIEAEKSDRFLGPLIAYFGDRLMSEVNPEVIRQAARRLYPGASAATRNRQVITPCQAAMNHGAELVGLPRIKVKRFPVETKIKEPATAEWVKSFAAQAEADGLPHLGALSTFLFGTGARIGEALSVTWSDVDLAARCVRIEQTKTTTARSAHLPPLAFDRLASIPSNREPEAKVFPYADRHSVKKTWDAVIERAELERLTPHSCRHGFATALLRRGYDVKTVAKLGGWKSARTVLETYAHAIDDPTLTDDIFDTNPSHKAAHKQASNGKIRRKST